MFHRSRRAFTLVELCVVIGTIAVLIALLMPAITKVAEQGKQIKCANNERQIYMALVFYSQENKGRLPIPPQIGETTASWMYPCPTAGTISYSTGRLWSYLAANPDACFDVFNCPTDLNDVRVVRKGTVQVLPRNFTYSFNAQMRLSAPHASPAVLGIRWTDIICPATKVLVIEEQWPNDGCAYVSGAGDEDDIFTNRHNHRGNQTFADGHVECLAPEDFGFDTNGTGLFLNKAQNATTCNLFYAR
jgi:prepilin-type processing-associated H-X9-DG protein